MAFEKFTANSKCTASATLTKGGVLLFNAKATTKYTQHDYLYAQLFYDKTTCEIGIMLTSDDNEASRIRRTGNYATISAGAFRRYFELPMATTHYSIRESDSMLILTPIRFEGVEICQSNTK